MSVSPSERRKLSSRDSEERTTRKREACELLNGLLGRHQEFFADSENRLKFLQDQDAASFYRLAQHINARLRGLIPREVRQDSDEEGGFLPLLHTPSHADKPDAFRRGFDAIHEYLQDSGDAPDAKLEKVAAATEALVIWVHPFYDGNGRTSRFMGKFIEQGGADVDALIAETISGRKRGTIYDFKVHTRESELADANNEDLLFDDDEREKIRAGAEALPDDIEGMYLSIKRLLGSDELLVYAKRRRSVVDAHGIAWT